MNILIVAGARYVGSHRVRYLLDAGHNSIVYDNLSNDHSDAVSGVGFRVTDNQRRNRDPAEFIADSTLAKREHGWEPQFTDLNQIIEHPWAFEEARWATC